MPSEADNAGREATPRGASVSGSLPPSRGQISAPQGGSLGAGKQTLTQQLAPDGVPARRARKPSLDPSYEALLVEALTTGDAPAIEFENYIRDLSAEDAKALYMRLSIEPPPSSDHLAVAFFKALPEAERSGIVNRLSRTTKTYSSMNLWASLAPGEDSVAMKLITRVDALDGVYLRGQPFGNKDGARLPFDTLVAVSRRTSKGWYHVTVIGDAAQGAAPIGASGFIEEYHVASQMPEAESHLHHVRSGEHLEDIAARYYKHSFAWGHDARVFVQAIYHANKDRSVVFRQQADVAVNQAALKTDNLIDALAFWKEARVVAGQALWMPSHDFVDRLKSSGAIHHASISTTMWNATAGAASETLSFLNYAAGFSVGLLEGAWGALEDLFMGVVDLAKMLWTIVKGLLNDFAEIKAFAKKISEAWKNRDQLLLQIASGFMSKWESPDDRVRGNFQGEFLGYVMMTAFIVMVTLGAGAAIAGAGRFGNFIKLIQFADAAGDITTYTRKLVSKIKLSAKALERTKQALGPKHATLSGPDKPHASHGHSDAAPQVAPERSPSPHGDRGTPDAPTTDHVREPSSKADAAAAPAEAAPAEAAHVPRPPTKNKGEPYVNPIEEPDLPHEHLEGRALPRLKPKPESSFEKIEKLVSERVGVAIGRKLKNAAEGHSLLEALARGDAGALETLGIKGVPDGYNTTGREWALVEGRDGFFIYAGRYKDISLPAGARIHAHTHPGPEPSGHIDVDATTTTDLPVPHEGKTYREIIADPVSAKRSGLAPSARDIQAISDGAEHVIYTRYRHRGNGRIANPVPGDIDPQVAIHLSGAKVVRFNSRVSEYLYQVSAQLKDATGRVVWSGELYCHWRRFTPAASDVFFELPPVLKRPPQAGWIEP